MDDFADRIDALTQVVLQWNPTQPASAAKITRLRKTFGVQWADLLVEVASQQTKAAKKLQPPQRAPNDKTAIKDGQRHVWWTTDRSLQQATAWQVARLKAVWFGEHEVWDLCCGVGGDAMHLAARGVTVAIDRDPMLAAFVQANLDSVMAYGSASDRVQVQCADVTQAAIPPQAWIHIDPDRRSMSQRTISVDHFSPDWNFVKRLIASQPGALVKLAPATKLDETSINVPFVRCWIALSGRVREQSLVTGEMIQAFDLPVGSRLAFSFDANGDWSCFSSAPMDQTYLLVSGQRRSNIPVGNWLIDPNAAIRAAGLTEAFTQVHDLDLIGHPSGFLTSDHEDLPAEVLSLAVAGRVLWSGSVDDRKLRRQLRSKNWFPETVKCRGTGHDPAKLQHRYRACGDQPVKLWIGKSTSRTYAAVTS